MMMMKKDKKKMYFVLERDNGLHLTKTGYYKIENGVLFKTNGFEKYYNESGLIIRDDYVNWTAFSYELNVPYKSYFDQKYNIKVNTKIQIIKDDSLSLVFDKVPIYVYLNWRERLCLSYRFNKLLVQKKDFWMWVTNIVVALGATIAGFMVVFC